MSPRTGPESTRQDEGRARLTATAVPRACGSDLLPRATDLDGCGRRLRVEGEVELVLLRNVEPQNGMEHVEGPPNIHEVFGIWPFARKAVHEPLEHPREVKDLLVRSAHRGQRIIPAQGGRETPVDLLLVHSLMGEDLHEGIADVVELASEIRRGDLIQTVCQLPEFVDAGNQQPMLTAQGRDDVGGQPWTSRLPPVAERAKGVENRGGVNGFLDHRAEHGREQSQHGATHCDE